MIFYTSAGKLDLKVEFSQHTYKKNHIHTSKWDCPSLVAHFFTREKRLQLDFSSPFFGVENNYFPILILIVVA